MKNKNTYVSINFLHLALVAICIVAVLMIGSLWNGIRTQNKLTKIRNHVERIYNAHQEEFVSTIKANNRSSYKSFLDKINYPEKGIYRISVLIKDGDGAYHVQARYSEFILNDADTQKLNRILSSEKSISTSESFQFETYSSDNNLYAFTPIKDNGVLVGYVVLSVQKSRNL